MAQEFPFPDLQYSYNALEPYIDAQTVEIHYSKHYKTYHTNFLKAVEDNNLHGKTMEEIFARVSTYPAAVRNNGGGYYNHKLYWEIISPEGGNQPPEKLLERIVTDFGSFESFKAEFENAAKVQFGSGWAWLVAGPDGKLFITSTPNQDNPLMDVSSKKGKPILLIDVWEHAYYLKYQNRRPEYISAFWNIINWKKVEELYLNNQ